MQRHTPVWLLAMVTWALFSVSRFSFATSAPTFSSLSPVDSPAAVPASGALGDADLRLVITGGIDGGRDGLETFFDAELFRGQQGLPLSISDAGAHAFESREGYFFAVERPISVSLLMAAASQPGSRMPVSLLVGAAAMGVFPEGPPPQADLIRRGLAAISRPAALEVRVVEGLRIFGVDLTPEDSLAWPTKDAGEHALPAVVAQVHTSDDAATPLFVFARKKGATTRALGIVDRLLHQPGAPPTGYLDVGGALIGKGRAHPNSVRALQALLLAREPVVMGTGRAELAAFAADAQILGFGPYVSPLASKTRAEGAALPPISRLVPIGDHPVLFTALGGLGDRAEALLPDDIEVLSAQATIADVGERAKASQVGLAIGLALSSESAYAALSSSLFDGVIHLASSKLAALPTVDDIDLTRNHAAGLHAGPGLIRISSADVTEAYFWFDATGRIERLRIERHPIVDSGPEPEDAVAVLAPKDTGLGASIRLPARTSAGAGEANSYTAADLDALCGRIVRIDRNAELSILPRAAEPLPVLGDIPLSLLLGWVPARSRVVTAQLSGTQLDVIWRAFDDEEVAARFVLSGASRKKKTIAARPVYPTEHYTLALTLEVLEALEQRGIAVSVPAQERVSAPTLRDLLSSALPHLDASTLASLQAETAGVAEPTLVAELTDVAITLSSTAVSGAAPFVAVRDARVQTPNSVSLGLQGKASLLYEGPWVSSGLMASTQFSRTSQTLPDQTEVVLEQRDSILLEWDNRLRLSGLFAGGAPWLPAPSLRLGYQTEWTPNVIVDADGKSMEQPRRSELRGLLGASFEPAPWLREFRVGVILENDLASAMTGGLEWGAESAASGQWNLGVLTAKIETLVRGYFPDPAFDTSDDIGLLWQTIGRVELPPVLGLTLSLVADNYMLWGKLPETFGPAQSLILGASLSYGARGKWLPLR